MIFDVLKHRWLRLEEQKIKQMGRDRSISSMDSAIVLYNTDEVPDLTVLKSWKELLTLKELTPVGFTSDKKAVARPNEVLLDEGAIKWSGGLASDDLKELLSKKFDLQINFLNHTTIMQSYVLHALHSKLKVGFPTQEESHYDIAIDVGMKDVDTFTRELKKYLTIIKN
ncbi:DUF6913 domain-containing protein [Nonlabens ponticola]|uniref:Uncharacterized protein n=1 Tax=Nonlabens ponticola TaxID=2496866 RepID=A0A3S9MXZ8_9FLAO|nr:hypothetical protein [Nonlabens ponticola]AZQ44014.1 hypothetical protein EJ995_07130 [Nonlabens ponticola]